MKAPHLIVVLILCCFVQVLPAQQTSFTPNGELSDFDPSTTLWYAAPAATWEEALPLGNGRLGAMVFGNYGEERIQINEESYWSGGPYSTVVEGGAEALPEIQRLIFEGKPIQAHKLFGRKLMGYPVEQQKYQSLANLHLFFEDQEEVSGYKRWLDLNTGVSAVEYEAHGVTFRREVFSSAPDQLIVVQSPAPGLPKSGTLQLCKRLFHHGWCWSGWTYGEWQIGRLSGN